MTPTTGSNNRGEEFDTAKLRLIGDQFAYPGQRALVIAAADRIEELEYLAGCLYQVIGQLADLAGVRDHPDVIRAMDNASDNAMTHKDLLPWPKTPLAKSEGRT